jgi:hypothetical protein
MHGLEILNDNNLPIFNIDISKNIFKAEGIFYIGDRVLMVRERSVENLYLPITGNDLNLGITFIKRLFDYTEVDYIGKRQKK